MTAPVKLMLGIALGFLVGLAVMTAVIREPA